MSAAIDEPLPGTAPHCLTWVAVEEPGPWGRNALADAPLPEGLRSTLRSLKDRGVGVLLIRRPDVRGPLLDRTVLIARTAPGGTLLRRGTTLDGAELTSWDPASLAAGRLPGFGEAVHEPALLVCTHSRRDACCARLGRSFTEALLRQAPGQADRVWECSHIGGHRFAPVTLSLPSGVVHGRLTAADAPRLLNALDAASVLPDAMRGRSSFPAPLQSAGVAVRKLIGEERADALDVLAVAGDRAVPVDAGWPVPTEPTDLEVRHVDGRSWRVTISPRRMEGERSESCGADPTPAHVWHASRPREVAAWR